MRENDPTKKKQDAARNACGDTAGTTLNRLSFEKSPYLLQHAGNPVDWYPWGDEAFERARTEDKPVFLSIGYSTCHWCHVMERESFEDAEVARLLNEYCICIKVDREERPDIDHLYMNACQMMTGSGGWPLTIIMTPDKKPFFAATYIPKEDRFGRIGMLNLIPQVRDAWKNRRNDVRKSAEQITGSLTDAVRIQAGGQIDGDIPAEAAAMLQRQFDSINGGFGAAPKFPAPHNLLFLLRRWKRTGDAETLSMVETTLSKMRLGGMYDHIGFGFHRYSTDASWHVPHFEKMLYDQAMLIVAYTEAYQATGRRKYRQTAEEIIAYVLRDMTAPSGCFYSAEDADSDGKEGMFYLWSVEELHKVLDPEEADLVTEMFGLSEAGNVIDDATQTHSGMNIFDQLVTMPQIADEKRIDLNELQDRWNHIRGKLWTVRERRIKPQKDDKILTDWNGLMIAALARAARAFDEPRYLEQAERSAGFLLLTMRTKEGRLLHRFRDNEAALQAHVDDYAFLIWGLIELYEATYEVGYLDDALRLNSIFIDHFWDDERGGFYFTADDGERLPVRTRELYDGALPSGNSVAMLNLARLARMTADDELERRTGTIANVFTDFVRKNVRGYTFLVSALDFIIGPTQEVVIVAGIDPLETKRMLAPLERAYLPHIVVLAKRSNGPDKLGELASYTRAFTATDGQATAYVCRNFSCELPTTDAGEMMHKLR